MKAKFWKHELLFKRAAGTSRGTLTTKDTWFVKIVDGNSIGIGECGMFRGLSADDRPDFEAKLTWACENINLGEEQLSNELWAYPSIQFGLETAFRSLRAQKPFELFPSPFTRGEKSIDINGLIWMGDPEFMKSQVRSKIDEGFNCIKLKIGALDFVTELDLLKSIRSEYSISNIELRVDANGAFEVFEAREKLYALAELEIHSIEQPIKTGQPQEMARLCEENILPIALDEELIGVFNRADKQALLSTIRPQYIILKPTLVGGFKGSDEWIYLAEQLGIGWWITSALESNIGLNAISQFTFIKNSKLPQGLGTGELFSNNISSPLKVTKGGLIYESDKPWDSSFLTAD